MTRSSWLFNPENDGQRTFRERFEAHVRKRDELIDKGEFSLPSREGILLIIASGRPSKASSVLPEKQIEAFRQEADRLAEERRSMHADVQVVQRAKPKEMQVAIANPEISDLIIIGHGSIARIWTEKRGDFSWINVAEAATHLKLGRFEQRMCGQLGDTGAVPLGTFAVSNLENITAAVGIAEVPDVNPPDELFVPVFDSESEDSMLVQVQQLNLRAAP